MIRVKNNGVASVVIGGTAHDPKRADVTQGKVTAFYHGKGQASFQILFTGPNPNWYEPKLITPADGEKEAVYDTCADSPTIEYGDVPYPAFECGAFQADVEDKNLNLLCEAQAVKVLGPEWEVVK